MSEEKPKKQQKQEQPKAQEQPKREHPQTAALLPKVEPEERDPKVVLDREEVDRLGYVGYAPDGTGKNDAPFAPAPEKKGE